MEPLNAQLQFPQEISLTFFSSFLQVPDDFREEIIIVITTWLLWSRRNTLRLGLKTKPLNQILLIAGGMLQDFLSAQDPKSATIQYKANFDGAVFLSSNSAGLSVVIQD